MGRGLSELQRSILTLALHNRFAEGRCDGSNGCDVYLPEILAVHFKWPLAYEGTPTDIRRDRDGDDDNKDGGIYSASQPWFSKAMIGAKRYAAGHAALSRAMARLQSRGLITIRGGAYSNWNGANLTRFGVAIAEQVTVKPLPKRVKC
jgi:hypothetical protein